jgi:zinc/manganese transport system substrate-binding protein
MTLRSQYASLAAVAAAALTGCASSAPESAGTPAPGGPIRIVAVERVYGDLARQIAGNGVRVDTILNSPSADPHAYEPATRDADAIAAADLVIENGLGYDAFADKLLAASPKTGRTVLDVGALGGHRVGDNPHVWYEVPTLAKFTTALASELTRREPAQAAGSARRRDAVLVWIAHFAAHLRAIGRAHAGARVAITEPVFDYVLHAASLTIATPPSFSHAIEEGNDPAPQDVDTMRTLLSSRTVAAFVYNSQTVEPSTVTLLEVARAAGTHVVPVTETLPAGETTQHWIDREVAALERAL